MSDQFLAVDVETANDSRASICDIGLVFCEGSKEVWRWSELIDPEEDFESFHTDLHSIRPRDVHCKATFSEIYSDLNAALVGQCIVSWGDFDRGAICQAACKYSFEPPSCVWIDAIAVARDVCPNAPNYELDTFIVGLDLPGPRHRALPDAWACSVVFRALMQASGLPLEHWADEFGEASEAGYSGPVQVRYPVEWARPGNPLGPFAGQCVLFTGAFSLGKSQMGRLASDLGFQVKTNWSKKVDLLVVGDRDLNIYETPKSRKHSQAEEARLGGHPVEIISQAQFLRLVSDFQRRSVA